MEGRKVDQTKEVLTLGKTEERVFGRTGREEWGGATNGGK